MRHLPAGIRDFAGIRGFLRPLFCVAALLAAFAIAGCGDMDAKINPGGGGQPVGGGDPVLPNGEAWSLDGGDSSCVIFLNGGKFLRLYREPDHRYWVVSLIGEWATYRDTMTVTTNDTMTITVDGEPKLTGAEEVYKYIYKVMGDSLRIIDVLSDSLIDEGVAADTTVFARISGVTVERDSSLVLANDEAWVYQLDSNEFAVVFRQDGSFWVIYDEGPYWVVIGDGTWSTYAGLTSEEGEMKEGKLLSIYVISGRVPGMATADYDIAGDTLKVSYYDDNMEPLPVEYHVRTGGVTINPEATYSTGKARETRRIPFFFLR
jgi:hypothetical protein